MTDDRKCKDGQHYLIRGVAYSESTPCVCGEQTLGDYPDLLEQLLDKQHLIDGVEIAPDEPEELKVWYFGKYHWLATPTTYNKFKAFQEVNPMVFELLIDLLNEYLNATNSDNCGFPLLWNRLRWEIDVKTGGASFKLPNNYAAGYSRLVMASNGAYEDVFETRCRKVCQICTTSKKKQDRSYDDRS